MVGRSALGCVATYLGAVTAWMYAAKVVPKLASLFSIYRREMCHRVGERMSALSIRDLEIDCNSGDSVTQANEQVLGASHLVSV